MWEHKAHVVSRGLGDKQTKMKTLRSDLDEHSADGWELVHVEMNAGLSGERDGALLFFKRPAR